MSSSLESLNEQLDELFVKQLELMQDYVTVTGECEGFQKSGFLNLAKARYIQGYHSVSKNCLYSAGEGGEDEEEEQREAIVTVLREKKKIDSSSSSISYEEPRVSVNLDGGLEVKLNNQFGVLSSGTLKTAKGDFKRCLERSMERLAVVEQMVAVRRRWGELMNEKVIILGVSGLEVSSVDD